MNKQPIMKDLRLGNYNTLQLQYEQLMAQRATAEQTKRVADILEEIARVMLAPEIRVVNKEQEQK